MRVGYFRCSTPEQIAGMEAQECALRATGCTKLFSETASSMVKRDQLVAALDFIRAGDTLVVTRLDRLCRSTADLLAIIARLEAKGVSLEIKDFAGSAVDTASPTGRMILTVLGAMAEMERALLLSRQRDGIARAKALGRYKGRAPTARAQSSSVKEMKASGHGASAIAAACRVSRSSVYRILADEGAV